MDLIIKSHGSDRNWVKCSVEGTEAWVVRGWCWRWSSWFCTVHVWPSWCWHLSLCQAICDGGYLRRLSVSREPLWPRASAYESHTWKMGPGWGVIIPFFEDQDRHWGSWVWEETVACRRKSLRHTEEFCSLHQTAANFPISFLPVCSFIGNTWLSVFLMEKLLSHSWLVLWKSSGIDITWSIWSQNLFMKHFADTLTGTFLEIPY